jgi:hypothetical protein
VPRPIPWLPRLPEIRRSVKHSARSHYQRKDIERLFELQPRAAQALVQGISPSAKVGPEVPPRPRLSRSIPRPDKRPHPRGHAILGAVVGLAWAGHVTVLEGGELFRVVEDLGEHQKRADKLLHCMERRRRGAGSDRRSDDRGERREAGRAPAVQKRF